MKKSIATFAGLNALGTTFYIVLVAIFLSHASQVFGSKAEDTVFIPVAMLLLFVLSASVTGSLILGRPILWYLDGKKKEAVSLLIATIGFLFGFTVLAFAVLAWISR